MEFKITRFKVIPTAIGIETPIIEENLLTITEEKPLIRKYFKDKINNTNLKDLSLIEYLKESLKSDNKDLCKGWDYLKTNLTEELKEILFNSDFHKAYYQSNKVDYILNQLFTVDEINEIDKEVVKQLGSWVYVWNSIKSYKDKEQDEDILKKELLDRGFIEVDFLKYNKNESTIDFNKRVEDYYKLLNDKKVICVLDVSCIGLMGSYDNKKEIEGKLIYSEQRKCLMLLPKRCSKRGIIIRGKFYYKGV
jgi:hypothetical protein